MKIKQKLIVGLSLAVISTIFALLMGQKIVFAAGFTATQIQNAHAFFLDEKTVSLEIDGKGYQLSGGLDATNRYGTYKAPDGLFCSPAGTKSSSYLAVFIDSGGPTDPNPLAPLKGTIDAKFFSDLSAVPDSVIYAGLNPQSCQRALPSDRTVDSKSTPPSSIFTDKTIGNIKSSDFSFQDGANILFSFSGKQIALYDREPEDNTRNFIPKTDSDKSLFCAAISGVTFNNADQEKNPLPASFEVAYYDSSNNNQCKKKTINISLNNPGKVATKVLTWNKSNIQSLTGSLTASLQGGSKTVYLKNPDDQCGGGWAIELSGANANSGTIYQVSSGGSNAGSIGLPNCKITSQRSVLIGGSAGSAGSVDVPVGAACDGGSDCKDGTCQGPNCTSSADTSTGGDAGASANTCALKSNGFSLAWLMCPMLEAADALASSLMNAFEDQLEFSVNKNDSQAELKAAWTIIKDIAAAVLVIVMLVMVISQAIGSGIFDAYTVRKLLPKMVAAAILMQLSWPLFVWIIDLFNYVGNGLDELLYLPFGGKANMDFGSLLNHAGVSTTKGIFLGWFGAFLGVLAAMAFLPTLLFAAFSAVLTLITGLLVLIFRKILILLLLIFSPLAIAFWILPGQGLQNYFKLWQNNFIKVLAMYPLVVGIIAAGRIFARVTGAEENGELLGFLFIMVGYFMPLAILPKTYKWGGSIMSSAAGAVNNLQNSAQRAAKQPIKDFGFAVYQGKRADEYDPTKSAFGIGRKKFLGKYGKAIFPDLNGRAWRRIQSGNFLPTNRSRNLTLAKGTKWSNERTEEALAYEQKFSRTHQDRGVSDKEAAEWNETTRKMGYKGPDIFKARGPGVGAGKWSALALFWKAYGKNDAALQKATADHLIDSKSGLEYRNPNFVAPYFDKDAIDPQTGKAGRMVHVPMFGHPMTIDRAYKDPGRYQILASMGGDFPPHNTPYGGNGGLNAEGYQKLYKRGVRWFRNPETGKLTENPDYNPDIARTFGIKVGQSQDKAFDGTQNLKPFEHYQPHAWAAHYGQASYDDARNNMAMGGSMGGAFMNMLVHGAKDGFAPGEQPEGNDMPLKQAAWVAVEATRTQQGRDDLKVLYTDPSTREIAEEMFKTAGITKFKDIYGKEHEFSVQNLWAANTAAEEKMKREGAPPTTPGREESLGTTDANGNFASIYGSDFHTSGIASTETTPSGVILPPSRRSRTVTPPISGGGSPNEEYPEYTNTKGEVVPAIPASSTSGPAFGTTGSQPAEPETAPAPPAVGRSDFGPDSSSTPREPEQYAMPMQYDKKRGIFIPTPRDLPRTQRVQATPRSSMRGITGEAAAAAFSGATTSAIAPAMPALSEITSVRASAFSGGVPRLDMVEAAFNNSLQKMFQARQAGNQAAMRQATQEATRLRGELNGLLVSKAPGWDATANRLDLASGLAKIGTSLAPRGAATIAVRPSSVMAKIPEIRLTASQRGPTLPDIVGRVTSRSADGQTLHVETSVPTVAPVSEAPEAPPASASNSSAAGTSTPPPRRGWSADPRAPTSKTVHEELIENEARYARPTPPPDGGSFGGPSPEATPGGPAYDPDLETGYPTYIPQSGVPVPDVPTASANNQSVAPAPATRTIVNNSNAITKVVEVASAPLRQTDSAQQSSNVLNIDHDALADTIARASEKGTRQGIKGALRAGELHSSAKGSFRNQISGGEERPPVAGWIKDTDGKWHPPRSN